MKTYSIVGMNHQKSEAFVATLSPGQDAVLIREPNNPFDPRAIAVWIDGTHVGHIPKNQNSGLAKLIDETGGNAALSAAMALDKAIVSAGPDIKAIPAKFVRSPNSGYPMVEVSE